jgi:hypothetical protein
MELKMKHKWHKEIEAWANGAKIEQKFYFASDWESFNGAFCEDDYWEYRIKPQPKETQYLYAYYLVGEGEAFFYDCKQDECETLKYLGKIKLEE